MPHRHRLIVLGLVIAAIAPFGFVRLAFLDAPAPDRLSYPIGEFDRVVASQLKRRLSQARFTAIERGSDELVVLYFELRVYPFVGSPELAYLSSRCTPLEAIDPWGMGGGIVQGDPATDEELAYLRSDAQPPCPGPAL
jgi:hypothetical protein